MSRLRTLLVLAFAVGVATAAGAADAVFPSGSRIGFVPPPGMVAMKGVAGFSDPRTGTAIVAIEMPGEAYATIAESFGREILHAQGFTLKTQETVKIGSTDALLISGDQTTDGKTVPKALLLAATGGMTALVVAQSAPATTMSGVDLDTLAALRTVVFRGPLSMSEQLAALPFEVNDLEGFHPARVLAGNSLLLTLGPNDAVKEAEQPILIVAQSFSQVPVPDQREAFARAVLVTNTFLSDAVLERSQSFRQNGADWHEIVATAKDTRSGTQVVVLQTIRFSGDHYLRMVGIVRSDQRDDVMPRMRRIVDAVMPKEP